MANDDTPNPSSSAKDLAHAVLVAARNSIEPTLRAAIERLPGGVARSAKYHLGWQDAHGDERVDHGGKAVRPALTLLCAKAVGGDTRSATSVAVAVELVHNFSLLHDDVMDGDHTRRHRPTAWSALGVPAAILAGDALLILAVDVLALLPAPLRSLAIDRLTTALLRMVRGQQADLAFEHCADITVSDAMSMAGDKTGALLGCACEVGALAGGADPSRAALLRRFGEHLGLAFQLADDVLGIWGNAATTGKPVGSDVRARKKSPPVVAALCNNKLAGKELAALYGRAEPFTELDVEHVSALIEQAGGRAWAATEIDRQWQASQKFLDAATPDPAIRQQLIALGELIGTRGH